MPGPADRSTVLFGRAYTWRFAGGRWSLLPDADGQALRDRMSAARREVLAAFGGAR